MTHAKIDRASGTDLVNLAVDVGPVPMQFGACLVLDPGPGYDVAFARWLIAQRVQAIPRLRHRLVPTPVGCGRPIWVEDPSFDIDHHLRVTRCPPPGDQNALLDLATQMLSEPLPASRPLWSMRLVTGLPDHQIGLIACFHHVLTDGMGGLAILAGLADGVTPPTPPDSFPQRLPSYRRLASDAWAARLRALARAPRTWRYVRRAVTDLRAVPRAARSSLNRPTGRHQRVAVVTAPLQEVRRTAHAHGGTVNDAVLTAVTGAIRALLHSREETLPALVVSIPVSARPSATIAQLGNQVGVLPISLPTAGTLAHRLKRTAAITRAGKAGTEPAASAELVAGVNRISARLHALRWMLNHQRLIHTVVSNLPGPAQPLTLAGATVRTIIPISLVRGNVTVAFTVLSYADALTVTIAADATHVPDLPILTAALEAEFAAMREQPPTGNPIG
ncbi:wax ester/triacylglycerol synthase family O-acyltransferase [Acrocarpospora macrocephala]|uniref:diacylglycerol O-acyltransferase n=1 Tax=Acrocarpospora macrocephala TaxID=150177 RepID=A0A5M3WLF4_9ACTN|nr:wax ester/triacylglycerol synthase domain-containing protein [Acrocarpospora macrocephala]GES07733.1 diacylglycerol O-acyltransferase [Acrocarpospora macrocephala]